MMFRFTYLFRDMPDGDFFQVPIEAASRERADELATNFREAYLPDGAALTGEPKIKSVNYIFEHPMTGEPQDAMNDLFDHCFASKGHVVYDRHNRIEPVPVVNGDLMGAYRRACRAYNKARFP